MKDRHVILTGSSFAGSSMLQTLHAKNKDVVIVEQAKNKAFEPEPYVIHAIPRLSINTRFFEPKKNFITGKKLNKKKKHR